MKKEAIVKHVLLLLVAVFAIALLSNCSATRDVSSKRNLMMLDTEDLPKNKAYYSKHNTKTRKASLRRYRKYNKRY